MKHNMFEDIDTLAAAVAKLLLDEMTASHDGPVGIIIPGGTTPKPVYDRICEAGVKAEPHVHLFYSDERLVPIDSPHSNYALTVPMVEALHLPEERVHRVRTELGLDDAADVLHWDIDRFLELGGRFPLAMLGLGADGHTASLFNDDDLASSQGVWAAPIHRPEPPDRVTLSPDLLRRAERIIFLVAGADKAAVIQRLTEHPDQVVAGRVVASAPSVEVWST